MSILPGFDDGTLSKGRTLEPNLTIANRFETCGFIKDERKIGRVISIQDCGGGGVVGLPSTLNGIWNYPATTVLLYIYEYICTL